jgi:hypothetical protein
MPVDASYEKTYLNIDWLRETGAEPAWFGLGFIQLKLDETERMHFWHPSLTPDVSDEEIHDHRYKFTSQILKGTMHHETWDFVSHVFGSHQMAHVSCEPGDEPIPDLYTKRSDGNVRLTGTYWFDAGSSYTFPTGQFHRTKTKECVSLLTREPATQRFARVIRKKGEPEICPFDNPKPVDELWNVIGELLKPKTKDRSRLAAPRHEMPAGYVDAVGHDVGLLKGKPTVLPVTVAPGYHLRDIARGVLGEPSKIFEEVEEFMDATEQGVSIMALVELADTIGAVEAYLAKHHPDISLSDLKAMSDVTKRAFENGRRS